MSICKTSLDKLGKAAFNSLSKDDQTKYTVASQIVTIISKAIEKGSAASLITDIGMTLSGVGIQLGAAALMALTESVTGQKVDTLGSAVGALAMYVKKAIAELVDQIKHDLASKLSVLFGIKENPGIIAAIMEWVYRSLIKPALA